MEVSSPEKLRAWLEGIPSLWSLDQKANCADLLFHTITTNMPPVKDVLFDEVSDFFSWNELTIYGFSDFRVNLHLSWVLSAGEQPLLYGKKKASKIKAWALAQQERNAQSKQITLGYLIARIILFLYGIWTFFFKKPINFTQLTQPFIWRQVLWVTFPPWYALDFRSNVRLLYEKYGSKLHGVCDERQLDYWLGVRYDAWLGRDMLTGIANLIIAIYWVTAIAIAFLFALLTLTVVRFFDEGYIHELWRVVKSGAIITLWCWGAVLIYHYALWLRFPYDGIKNARCRVLMKACIPLCIVLSMLCIGFQMLNDTFAGQFGFAVGCLVYFTFFTALVRWFACSPFLKGEFFIIACVSSALVLVVIGIFADWVAPDVPHNNILLVTIVLWYWDLLMQYRSLNLFYRIRCWWQNRQDNS